MKRTLFSFFLISFVTIVLSSYSIAQMHPDHHGQFEHKAMMKAERDEVVCPVTDRVMEKSEAQLSYTLYFASEAAKEAFLKSPAKFLTATCPVMGGEANKLTAPYSNYDGVAYFHCCAGCKEMFEKEPRKYIGQRPKKSEMDSHSEKMGKPTTASAMACGAGTGGCSGAKTEKDKQGHTCWMSQKVGTASCSSMKAEGTAFTDPVCGMKVFSKDGIHADYKGTEYRFCSEQCKEKFEKEPKEYIKQ